VQHSNFAANLLALWRLAGPVPGRSLLGALVVLTATALLAPQTGFAQTAEMALPTIAKDRGLRSGDFVMHPSISVQGHHDTNLFNGDELEQGNKPVAATSIRIIPRLALSNDLANNTTFVFSSAGDARVYISDNKAVTAQDNIGGNASLDLTFGQRKAIAFSVFDHFVRALRANNWETTTSLNRNSNDAGARIEFHPGDVPERRPFNVALMGSYSVDRFTDFKPGDVNMVRTRLTGSWRFLPKTAAILDARWDFRNYDNPTLSNSGLSFNSRPFRALAGIAGALTKRVSFQVEGGWGVSLHDSGDSFNSYLATASIGVRPSESTRLTLGYTHDFRDVYYGNFTQFHRGMLNLHQRFGNIMDVRATFGASYGTYGTLPRPSQCSSPRRTAVTSLSTAASRPASRWHAWSAWTSATSCARSSRTTRSGRRRARSLARSWT
jgi:hypothetical protein